MICHVAPDQSGGRRAGRQTCSRGGPFGPCASRCASAASRARAPRGNPARGGRPRSCGSRKARPSRRLPAAAPLLIRPSPRHPQPQRLRQLCNLRRLPQETARRMSRRRHARRISHRPTASAPRARPSRRRIGPRCMTAPPPLHRPTRQWPPRQRSKAGSVGSALSSTAAEAWPEEGRARASLGRARLRGVPNAARTPSHSTFIGAACRSVQCTMTKSPGFAAT